MNCILKCTLLGMIFYQFQNNIHFFFTGNVSVGNLPKFLPFVLKEIENQPKRQYLLLHSLKEVNPKQTNPLLVNLLS